MRREQDEATATPRGRRLVTALLATILCGSVASAHEFWIEPLAQRVAAGDTIDVALRVGDGYPGQAFPRDPRHVVAFRAIAPDGARRAVDGSAGAEPAGSVMLRGDGTTVLAYESAPRSITLDAAKFESYLASEGLDHVIAERARRKQSTTPGRERYSRCAKSLVSTSSEPLRDRVVGLPLELLLEPASSDAESETGYVTIRLSFRGQPVAGASVRVEAIGATERDDSEPAVRRRRTDAEGRVRVRFDGAGRWLVSSVHMLEDDASDSDWRSYWASLTFASPLSSGRQRAGARSVWTTTTPSK